MVMGRDSCSEGRRFESLYRILDGHFFTYIWCKNCNDVCLKRPEINDNRDRGWPIFLIKRRSGMAQLNKGFAKLTRGDCAPKSDDDDREMVI